MYQCSIPVLNEECRVYEINGNIFIKFTGFTASENNHLFLKALQNPREQIHRKGWIKVSILDGFSIQVLGKFILTSQLSYFIIWSLIVYMIITVPPYLLCFVHWSKPALTIWGKSVCMGTVICRKLSDLYLSIMKLVDPGRYIDIERYIYI